MRADPIPPDAPITAMFNGFWNEQRQDARPGEEITDVIALAPLTVRQLLGCPYPTQMSSYFAVPSLP
jgi:hypothetical protein